MGLDMYLLREKRVTPKMPTTQRGDADFPNDILRGVTYEDGKIVSVIIQDGDETKTFTPEPEHTSFMNDEVAYWRKANHIHKWFVDHVQDGVDDCEIHNEVTEEILRDLVSACKLVLADHSKAEEVLPTSGGFFFGCTEYNDGYFRDLESTAERLENIIRETDFNTEAIYYWSSW